MVRLAPAGRTLNTVSIPTANLRTHTHAHTHTHTASDSRKRSSPKKALMK